MNNSIYRTLTELAELDQKLMVHESSKVDLVTKLQQLTDNADISDLKICSSKNEPSCLKNHFKSHFYSTRCLPCYKQSQRKHTLIRTAEKRNKEYLKITLKS